MQPISNPKLDHPKKTFEKLFAQMLILLQHSNPTMQAQALQALVSISSSHFVLYMQDGNNLKCILELCSPKQINEELTSSKEEVKQLAAR